MVIITMATPIFTLNLNHKILPGHVTIGKYDGTHSCLTATTTGDQILIHSPHRRTGSNMGHTVSKENNKEIILLSINQSVTAICAGRLNPSKENDILVVGTATNILAYDVENNMDIFYKEVPDGVSVITIGKLGSINKPLAIVGGNCTIQGFDFEGNDLFWTVTGDNVCSLALLDFDGDGENELVVGSEDYDIRIFKEDSIIGEQTELEAVTVLTSFRGNTFGYGLSNGTVGIYENLQRLWRVKSKSRAIAVYSYDLDGDGIEELITGWSNGKIDARSSRTGEVIFKDNLSHSVAGIVEGDYRLVGKNDLICCSVEGEVRGYNLCKSPGVKHSIRGLGDVTMEQETISELFSRKQALLAELRNYEGNAQLAGVGSTESAEAIAQQLQQQVGVIPAKTRLQTAIAINMGNDNKSPHIEIALSTNNETIIRAMMVFAEGMFEGETHIVHPKESDVTTKMCVALYPPRDVAVDIHIKALVGYPGSQHFHVFELTRQLPQFSMYAICDEPVCKTSSFVSFNLNERIQRIAMWINQNFHLSNELDVKTELNVSFLSLRDNTKFTITMASEEFVIWTHNMGLAGDLIQSLAAFLNIEDLQVKADFHNEQQQVSALLQQVTALQETRLRLTAETADHSGIVRSLVMRAEDARHLRDIKDMRKWYNEINNLSTDLIQGYNIRCTNHQELLEALKKVNLAIQKASRLRVGKYKTSVINLCRSTLKNNNVKSLIKVMKTGEA